MHLHTLSSSLLVLAIMVGLIVPTLAAFDRRELRERGEVYVVALHDAYQQAAKDQANNKRTEIPRFFSERVAEIEKGGDLFPANPEDFPIADAEVAERLDWAYAETFDVTTSEAGDIEPVLVARLQIAYEQWLITMHLDPADEEGPELDRIFNRRLDALTRPSMVSEVAPAPAVPRG